MPAESRRDLSSGSSRSVSMARSMPNICRIELIQCCDDPLLKELIESMSQ